MSISNAKRRIKSMGGSIYPIESEKVVKDLDQMQGGIRKME